MKKKYPIYSDTHLNFTMPWTRYDFVSNIKNTNADGLILTGDISCGLTIENCLSFLVKKLNIPIYFVLGNHDFYSSSFSDIESKIKKQCLQYSNLHWMTSIESLSLTDNIGIIGEDGWYDSKLGNPAYLAYNLDWVMISEFRAKKSFQDKINLTRQLATQSTANLKVKLQKALEKYQTIYILTHVPPWQEAALAVGSMLEEFWLPYNVNSEMGIMIEDVMSDKKDQHVVVVAGHVHCSSMIHVTNNIECWVQPGKYLNGPSEHNTLYI